MTDLKKIIERYENLPPLDRFTASQGIYNLIDIEVQRLLHMPRDTIVDYNLVFWEQVKRYVKENLK